MVRGTRVHVLREVDPRRNRPDWVDYHRGRGGWTRGGAVLPQLLQSLLDPQLEQETFQLLRVGGGLLLLILGLRNGEGDLDAWTSA